MKKTVLVTLVICLTISVFSADILTLNNKMTFEGDVKKIKDCTVIFKADGKKYFIPAEDINSIKFENPRDKEFKSYIELLQIDPNNCLKGNLDADNYHGKAGFHVAMGVLFGPFAVIGAAVSSPSPYSGKETMMMSQNQKLFNDPVYLNCYQKKARAKNLGNTGLGWLAWVLIIVGLGSA